MKDRVVVTIEHKKTKVVLTADNYDLVLQHSDSAMEIINHGSKTGPQRNVVIKMFGARYRLEMK